MKWSCSDVEDKLSALYDGELPEAEARHVRRHIDDCANCADLLSSFEQLSTSLGATTDADPFFLTRFRARRDSLSVAPWWTWRQLALRLLPVAAAAVFAAGAAVWLSANGAEDLGELEHHALGTPGVVQSLEADELTAAVIGMAIEPVPEP